MLLVENLDEVNARSVPNAVDSDDSSVILSGKSTKNAEASSSYKPKSTSPILATGVQPPKTFKYPSVSKPKSSSSNMYETDRY